jgi:hypothetical protein
MSTDDGVWHITGYELWLIYSYNLPDAGYRAWRASWDTTEQEDFIYGYAT